MNWISAKLTNISSPYLTKRKVLKLAVKIIGILFALALGILIAYYLRKNELAQGVVAQYGYAGIFLVGFITSFNILVPIPAVTFLSLFVESGLNYWWVIILLSLGMTLADFLAYFVGRVGREAISHTTEKKILHVLQRALERYRLAPMFFLLLFSTFAPLPNELILAPLGFLGYRIVYVFPIVLFGNFFFNTLYASGVTGLFGIL